MAIHTVQIAIVEDDSYYNSILTRYIENICGQNNSCNLQFSVHSYKSGFRFVDSLENSLDFLLLDYYLYAPNRAKQINGEDILKIIRDTAPNCQVILLTALTDPLVLKKMHAQGILAHITKNRSSTKRVGHVLQQAFDSLNTNDSRLQHYSP